MSQEPLNLDTLWKKSYHIRINQITAPVGCVAPAARFSAAVVALVLVPEAAPVVPWGVAVLAAFFSSVKALLPSETGLLPSVSALLPSMPEGQGNRARQYTPCIAVLPPDATPAAPDPGCLLKEEGGDEGVPEGRLRGAPDVLATTGPAVPSLGGPLRAMGEPGLRVEACWKAVVPSLAGPASGVPCSADMPCPAEMPCPVERPCPVEVPCPAEVIPCSARRLSPELVYYPDSCLSQPCCLNRHPETQWQLLQKLCCLGYGWSDNLPHCVECLNHR
ncbi:MAG: hypothetical protein FRX49_09886 [Trebouxia sp. A1-2]|nr:MAG: hypothetical protein FRX49_09886 [Trebouxia sp. A1-2]